MPTVFNLPWPPKALHSHAKGHWRPKATASAVYRRTAWALALEAGVVRDAESRLIFAAYPPDNRRRDCQNMGAPLKAAIDGIADAMGCDDNRFKVRFPEEFGPVVKGGRITVEIRRGVE